LLSAAVSPATNTTERSASFPSATFYKLKEKYRGLGVVAKLGKMRPGLSLHGLRHARGVELAEAGAATPKSWRSSSMRPSMPHAWTGAKPNGEVWLDLDKRG
jgi:hypothetical protein